MDSFKIEIPPPEKRLCKRIGKDGVPHMRPIQPSSWRRGCRAFGCAKCDSESRCSPQAKKLRAKKWDKQFIACIRHPERLCHKSLYVHNGHRRCESCCHHLVDGNFTSAFRRSFSKRSLKKSLDLRTRFLIGRMRGLLLFERETGMNLETLGLTGYREKK